MCSISGGTKWDSISEEIWKKSIDRGRDFNGKYINKKGGWIGNRRGTPTTEPNYPIENQPVGNNPKIVFNGIISNDKELGIQKGEADTSVLPRILDFSSLEKFRDSLQEKIIGSYAIAVLFSSGEIWLANNYKPIWILHKNNEFYFSSLKHHLNSREAYRFPPYSVGILNTKKILTIKRKQSKNALVICSSGLDSTSVASYAITKHKKVDLLYFDYGCRATFKESNGVKQIAKYLKCGTINLKISKTIFSNNSPLLSKEKVISKGITGAEYAHEWVPARNLIMLSMAVGYAEANNYGFIYLGTNLEEAGAYPDNEEQFILDFNFLLYGALQNGTKIEIKTPLGGLMKHEIVPFGNKYKTPFHLTWSCYEGGENHCGKCGPCYMRKTAFERNGLKDPVIYEENNGK